MKGNELLIIKKQSLNKNTVTHHHKRHKKSHTLELSIQASLVYTDSAFEDGYLQQGKSFIPNLGLSHNIDYMYMQTERNYTAQSLLECPSKKVVILDIDETLIYNCGRIKGQPPLIFPRPYYYDMLIELSEYYEIWVWSASEMHYISAILKKMDPHRIVKKILSRNDCTLSKEGKYVKDVGKFVNFDPSGFVIVDNLLTSFCTVNDNGILVKSYYGDPADKELLRLTEMLLSIRMCKDLRSALKSHSA